MTAMRTITAETKKILEQLTVALIKNGPESHVVSLFFNSRLSSGESSLKFVRHLIVRKLLVVLERLRIIKLILTSK